MPLAIPYPCALAFACALALGTGLKLGVGPCLGVCGGVCPPCVSEFASAFAVACYFVFLLGPAIVLARVPGLSLSAFTPAFAPTFAVAVAFGFLCVVLRKSYDVRAKSSRAPAGFARMFLQEPRLGSFWICFGRVLQTPIDGSYWVSFDIWLLELAQK